MNIMDTQPKANMTVILEITVLVLMVILYQLSAKQAKIISS